jgi:hypothetical protein
MNRKLCIQLYLSYLETLMESVTLLAENVLSFMNTLKIKYSISKRM